MLAGFFVALCAVGIALLSPQTSAQQYIGDVIANSLPNVPGSEITYFRIKDPAGKNNNLTLINYYSHQDNGNRIVESQIKRAVVIIHGLNRDPGTYESNMMSALAQVTSDPNVNRSTIAIMAPYFPNGDDKNYGYPWTDGLSPGRGSTTNCLVWKASAWSAGANNQYPYISTNTSSYTVLDQIIQYFDNPSLFPNMNQIVIAGHSLGAQTVQRYAAIGQPGTTRSAVSYWVANPNSYAWFSTSRPLSTAGCSTYDNYRDGYSNFAAYPMSYGVALVNSGRANILATYNSKAVNYGRGTQDLGDDSSTCAPYTTGANRNERFFNFIAAFPPTCADPASRNCDTVDFVNVGHDGGQMMASPAGQARLFLDNFYGNGSRAYDFGYPRQQAGDDPYPDPSLNGTAASVNNNTYAGNMTYWGCWSDQSPRSLPNLAYDNNTNTIEQCTTICTQNGNTIAGLEFGSQCFCGNSLGYKATQVIDSSCASTCPGNSNETCGGYGRLSLFSNGRPYVQGAPGTPETVGDFYYVSCYTEASSGRALRGKSTAGSFMTLEYCSSFCAGFRYFGTEYGSECYCGNDFAPGANRTSDDDCSMLCANATTEFCGAGNRLTVYEDPDWTPPSTTTTSSTSTPTTQGAGSSPTGVSCPASNNTIVLSNGRNFTIECGIDHQGGDLTSIGVSSFQGCIDACAQNSKCVDVSLQGSACYLKSSLGAAVPNAGISGAKLVASTATTTSTDGNTATTTTSTALPTNTALSCPGSNSTAYIASNGESFLIECGIDHAGGDMSSKNVGSFGECINACATTLACVDVSFVGASCYLKSSLGAPVQNGVWGAKLVPSASTSLYSTSSSSSSSSSSTLSTSSTINSVTLSTSSSSTQSTDSPTGSSTSTATSSVISVTTTSSSSSSLTSSTLDTSTVINSLSLGSVSSSSTSSSVTTFNPISSHTSAQTSLSVGSTSSVSSVSSPSTDTTSSISTGSQPTGSSLASTLSTIVSPTTSSGLTSSSLTTSMLLTSTTPSTTSEPTINSLTTSTPSVTSESTSSESLTTSSETTSSSTLVSTTLPSGFSYVGCFVDNTRSRTLPHSNGTSSKQTPQQCAINCAAIGYRYSGTEHSNQCWCGNSVPTTSAPVSECKTKCSGDKAQHCGAAKRLSVVVDNSFQPTFFAVPSYKTWNLMGCYIDSSRARLLKSAVSLSAYGGGSNATIGNCMSACAAKRLHYCGAEYYAECWGSKVSPSDDGTAPGADPLAAGCNYPCKGNNSEACGGSTRILVYVNNGTVA